MPSTLGAFIRRRRLLLDLSQLELATRAGHGTKQEHISRLERGRVILPRWHRLLALADALEVTPGELLLRAGLITDADLITAADSQDSAGESASSAAASEIHPRPFICPPTGVIEDWETAAVFVCA
jgi:transcriptional regulator with XRE-family HTH domain